MGKSEGMKIVVSKDGPHQVSGDLPLSMQIITPNKEGLSWDWKQAKKFDPGSTKYDLAAAASRATSRSATGAMRASSPGTSSWNSSGLGRTGSAKPEACLVRARPGERDSNTRKGRGEASRKGSRDGRGKGR